MRWEPGSPLRFMASSRTMNGSITSGTQGLQHALLAPGWIHGCLGLWFRLRHYATMRRAKPALFALYVLLPLLSAAGFVRMKRAIVAMHAILPAPDPKLVLHQVV